MHALVIDNDRAILILLGRVVRREGWDAILVSDDREAHAAFEPGKFDLAIIDVDLDRGVGGIELARELRRRDPHLNIAMISGDPTNKEDVRKARLGPFFGKPFQLEEIAWLLRSL